MARESTLGQRGVLAVDSDLPLFAAFPEDKVFRLDSGVHRLRVIEDFAAFPRGAVRVRIGFQPRTATPAPERQQPLPGGHSLTVVGEGANILELLVKNDHIPGIGLIVRQGGPCHDRLDCGDGALATTARREGLSDGRCLRLQPARRWPLRLGRLHRRSPS